MKTLLRPEFLAAAVVLVAGTVVALLLSFRRRPRSKRVGEVREFASDRPSVTFADVAGLDEAMTELREVKDYLAHPDRFRALGAELPRGVLLHGPPGTGKTLLARALAGEAKVPFYYVSAASFVEQFVGVGAARIRQLFQEAKRHAPSIVFIDELDAVGRSRRSGTAGDREFDHTLNQLLVELDGFSGASGVLILGASNRPELLDPALVRPGRFDRRIQIDRPDVVGREAILRLHAARRPFGPTIDWRQVARDTPGLAGADLANIVNEASLLAARGARSRITGEDVEQAVERVLGGQRSSRVMSDHQKRLIAYHEAGHGLLSLLLRGVKPPPRVSILASTAALSKSPWALDEDHEVLTKRELMARLMVLLGGRAAEINVLGEPSTRAENDLKEAHDLARRMVERWAMTGRFELRTSDGNEGNYSPSDLSAQRLLARAEHGAREILADHQPQLAALASALIKRESLPIQRVAEIAGVPDVLYADGKATPRGGVADAGALEAS